MGTHQNSACVVQLLGTDVSPNRWFFVLSFPLLLELLKKIIRVRDVYMHICVCVCVHARVCVWVHMPRPKANIECLLLLTTFIFILFYPLRQGLQLNLQLAVSDYLASKPLGLTVSVWDCKCTQGLCGTHTQDFMLAQEALCPLSHPQAHPLDISYFISFPNLFCSLYLYLLQAVVNVTLYTPVYKNLVARCGVAHLQSQEVVP